MTSALTVQLEVDEAGELTDLGAVVAESRATVVESATIDDTVSAAMRRKMTESAAAYGETPEEMWHSWTTLLVTMMSGGNSYYTPAAAGLLGLDPASVGHPGPVGGPLGPVIADSLAQGAFGMAGIRRVIDEVPAGDLARLAPQLQQASQVLAAIQRIPYDAEHDEVPACFVPLLLAIGVDAISHFAALGSLTKVADGGVVGHLGENVLPDSAA